MRKSEIQGFHQEAITHLTKELLPFWLNRCMDSENGGYITHFNEHGEDIGVDEKSLISQTRTLYTMASAHRAGYGKGKCKELAEHGIHFLLEKLWDDAHGGFFWLCDRRGNPLNDRKILYGHSFAIYALGEYTLATNDPVGREYAERTFDLISAKCFDPEQGGYFEMFDRTWRRAGPGPMGGDRKTFDVHMHLMEAFTTLYECTGKTEHFHALEGVIDLLTGKMLHPVHGTAISQFTPDWQPAPHIEFDIVWGHDRFSENGIKAHPDDITSFGHNLEFAWLFLHSLRLLGRDVEPFLPVFRTLIDHGVRYGIDETFGGIYVEGSHTGEVYDREKEFWQQAEGLIALLDACLLFGEDVYWNAYRNVHRFVFDRVIHRDVGEWWPLLRQKGEPIWTHMGDSWKINYHTVRSMIQCIHRLESMADRVE